MYIIEIILKKKYVTFKYINVYCSLFWLEYHAMFGRANSLKSLPYITYIDENANGVLSWHLQQID